MVARQRSNAIGSDKRQAARSKPTRRVGQRLPAAEEPLLRSRWATSLSSLQRSIGNRATASILGSGSTGGEGLPPIAVSHGGWPTPAQFMLAGGEPTLIQRQTEGQLDPANEDVEGRQPGRFGVGETVFLKVRFDDHDRDEAHRYRWRLAAGDGGALTQAQEGYAGEAVDETQEGAEQREEDGVETDQSEENLELGGDEDDLEFGNFELEPQPGSYRVPSSPGAVTLELRRDDPNGDGSGDLVSSHPLQIVAPAAVLHEQADGKNVKHQHQQASVGLPLSVFLGPADVSFPVEFGEGEADAETTGWFSENAESNGLKHKANSFGVPYDYQAGKGTFHPDNFDRANAAADPPPPHADGTFTWRIPQRYRNEDDEWTEITNVEQTATLDAQGTMSVRKGQAGPVSKRLDDPGSDY